MTDERPPDDEAPRRPRVVDRRISARAREASDSAASDADSAPPTEEPGPAEPRTEPPPEPHDPGSPPPASPAVSPAEAEQPGERVWTPEQEEAARQMAQQIRDTPTENWVLNVAMTLIDVAGVKLEGDDLPGAQLAIDSLAALTTGIADRLGEAGPALRRALADLQMAYAQRAAGPPSGAPR